jgi:hypothetical protein
MLAALLAALPPTLAALPALLSGIAAFRERRQALMTPDAATSTHRATEAEDDAELERRRAEAETAKGTTL